MKRQEENAMDKPVKLSSVCFGAMLKNLFKTSKVEFFVAILSLFFGLISAALFPFAAEEVISAAALGGTPSIISSILLASAFAVSLPLFTASFIMSLKRLINKNLPVFTECCKSKLFLTEERVIDALAAENELKNLKELFFTMVACGAALLFGVVLAIISAAINGLALTALPIVLLTFFFALFIAKGKGRSVTLVPVYTAACFAAWGITVFSDGNDIDVLFKNFALLTELTAVSAVFVSIFRQLCVLNEKTVNLRYFLGLEIRDDRLPPIKGDVRLYDVSIGVNDIIQKLNAHFEAGRLTAVLGGSGSGKSHLYRLLKGELRCESGYVMYDDSDVAVTNPALTAAFTASVSLKLADGSIETRFGYDKASETPADFQKKLDRFGLSKLYAAYGNTPLRINDLSYEDRVSLAIGEALAKQPRILLINNLLDNLNPDERKETIACLKKLGITVIVFTSSDETASLCENTVKLQKI